MNKSRKNYMKLFLTKTKKVIKEVLLNKEIKQRYRLMA